MNEQELIEKARAAQLERDRKAEEERNRQARAVQAAAQRVAKQNNAFAYMLEWAKKFPALAKKVGLPGDSWTLTAGSCQICVEKKGRLYGFNGRIKNCGDCYPVIEYLLGYASNYSEAEIRQQVDKLFENALMGNSGFVL